jgi:hypothetical protein
MVHIRKIKICEVLAGKVSNRNPFSRGGFIAADNPVKERQNPYIFEAPPQQAPQNLMIHAVEIPAYIEFQKAPVFFALLKGVHHRGVGSLPFPARVAVIYHRAFKERVQHIHNRVVHNPLFKRRGADNPRFGILYRERAVAAPAAVKSAQFIPDRSEIAVCVPAKRGGPGAGTVPLEGFEKSEPDIMIIRYGFK